LCVDLSDKNIRLLIKDVTELEKGCERGAFEAALKETDIGAIEVGLERQLFLCQVSCFSGIAELFAKDRIEPGHCFHAMRYQYLQFQAL
jgi:hypothetical protein